MARKSTAPANAANADDELPKTAVLPRGKDLVIQSLQDQIMSMQGDNPPPAEPDNTSEATPEEETFKKRYGDLRRHLQQKESGFQKEISDLKAQVTQLNTLANSPMPSTKEEFEAWKAKYPQIASFVEIIADEKASQRAAQLQEELSGVKEKLSKTEEEKAFATLKVLVPDLEATVKSEEYQAWFTAQPAFVQEELNTSTDPHRVAYWIDIYKMSIAPKKTATTPKADKLGALDTSVKNSGITPNANSGKWKYTQAQIAKMSTKEYEAQEAEIIAARNSGQILDDLSKRNSVFEL